jgi:signal transduction histidine kinase
MPESFTMATHTSFSARVSNSVALRYAVAIVPVLIAYALCSVLNPYVGNSVSYASLLPAIAFSAWYCGVGPSIIAIVLAVVGLTVGFVPKAHAFHAPSGSEWVGILAFLLASAIFVFMGESRRRQNDAMRRAQGELEERVRQRTADLDVVNRNLRELSARLMQLQDDERRKIARELHDSVGQMLAALSMNLSTVRNDVERLAKTAAALSDSEGLVREMSTEVRTISHLLHPPLLDEAGLSSALRWYVDGFTQRSRIKVDLDMPEEFGRLPREMETAIFRVVQECLTNIHRHSESPVAKIYVRQKDRQVLVEIRDQGKGIPADKLEEMASHGTPGVGIRGMRERLRQLGGTLEIDSSGDGTIVVVRLPLEEGAAHDEFSMTDRPSPAAA